MFSGVIMSGDIADSPVMKEMDDNQGLMIIRDASHKHIQPLTAAYFPKGFYKKYDEIFIEVLLLCGFVLICDVTMVMTT